MMCVFGKELMVFSIITGANGSGKTQILEYIAKRYSNDLKIIHINSAQNRNYLYHPSHDYEIDYFEKDPKRLEDFTNKVHTDFSGGNNKKLSLTEYERTIFPLVKKVLEEQKARSQNIDFNSVKKTISEVSNAKFDEVETAFGILSEAFHVFYTKRETVRKNLDSSPISEIKNLIDYYKETNPDATAEQVINKISDRDGLQQLCNSYIDFKFASHKKPWDEINQILRDHSFKFTIHYECLKGGNKPEICLFKEGIPDAISIKRLSSGEKMILDVMAWKFYHFGLRSVDTDLYQMTKTQLILLDEPDAHFDPKLCEQFYNIIHKELVKNKGIQVIMTTHRIDTVKLAPEGTVFHIDEKDGKRHIQPIAQRAAIAVLTNNKFAVVENTNYVLTENDDDQDFYDIIYQKFKATLHLPEHFPKLVFIPVGIKIVPKPLLKELSSRSISLGKRVGKDRDMKKINEMIKVLQGGNDVGGGCTQIKKKLNILGRLIDIDPLTGVVLSPDPRKAPTKEHKTTVIRGLIDRDQNNEPTANIDVLKVYSFENYLCMPLPLFYLMRNNSIIMNKEGNSDNSSISYKVVVKCVEEACRPELLSFISEHVFNELKRRLQIKIESGDQNGKSKKKLEKFRTWLNSKPLRIELVNGLTIQWPEDLLNKKGHTVHNVIGSLFNWDRNQMYNFIMTAIENIHCQLLPKTLLKTIKDLGKDKADEKKDNRVTSLAENQILYYINDNSFRTLEQVWERMRNGEQEEPLGLTLFNIFQNTETVNLLLQKGREAIERK